MKEYFCSTDNVPYASFESTNKFITFLKNRWDSRMVTISKDDYKEISKFIILNSKQEIKPVSIYDNYNVTDKSNIETEVQKAISAYDEANRQLNPAEVKPEPLKTETVYVAGVGFESFIATVDTSVDGKREIFLVTHVVRGTASCISETISYSFGNAVTLNVGTISNNGQRFEVTLEELFSDSGCEDSTGSESRGKYEYKLWIYTNPILSDGTLDTTRRQIISGPYPITFEL
jgi:hypothetical protein